MNEHQVHGNITLSALKADTSRPTARKYIDAGYLPDQLQTAKDILMLQMQHVIVRAPAKADSGWSDRVKIEAARRRTTLGNLVIEGLERVMNSPSAPGVEPLAPAAADDAIESDSYGVPFLKRRSVKVTDSMIEEMRKEEGI
jgi:hypothetical protein